MNETMESREVLIPTSGKSGSRIELQELSSERSTQNSRSFFAWIDDHETRRASIRHTKVIPWKGIIALAISALTTILSLVLLLVLQCRKELWPTTGWGRVMQPASFISAFMSLNGAALHVALMEGVTVAWWYRATRPTANLEELHSLWYTGTSSFSAAQNLRKLSYVSLAALFVAILPLNGFLLQAAITTPMTTIQKWSQIPVPISRSLPLGYSGEFSPLNDSTWGLIDNVNSAQIWAITFQQVKNVAGSQYAGYAYIGAYDQCETGQTNCTDVFILNGSTPQNRYLLAKRYYFNDTQSTFSFRAQGVGFNTTCEESTIPYDLQPVEGQPDKTDSVFYTNVDWDYHKPNTITIEMKWKPNDTCKGEYEYRYCTLTAATVEYPINMQLDIAKIYRGPYFSLPANTTWHDDKVIKELPVHVNESVDLTTYGGIASKFNDWYKANTTFTFRPDGSWNVYTDGPMSFAIEPGFFNGTINLDQECQVEMSLGLSSINYFEQMTKLDYNQAVEFGPWAYTDIGSPIDLVLNQIRQSMFLASIYQGAQWYSWSFSSNVDGSTYARVGPEDDYVQHVDALRTKVVPVYRIRWALWGASIAITYIIILLIVPTFWGFWVLKVQPTMSPIDVARALNAPVVDHDHQNHLDVDALLKQVGKKNIHRDLGRQSER